MSLCRHIADLAAANDALRTDYLARERTHTALIGALREVNLMIGRAANLRVGEAKMRVVNGCRAAVKAGGEKLFDMIRIIT